MTTNWRARSSIADAPVCAWRQPLHSSGYNCWLLPVLQYSFISKPSGDRVQLFFTQCLRYRVGPTMSMSPALSGKRCAAPHHVKGLSLRSSVRQVGARRACFASRAEAETTTSRPQASTGRFCTLSLGVVKLLLQRSSGIMDAVTWFLFCTGFMWLSGLC